MAGKKFNLGEILKKINEESGSQHAKPEEEPGLKPEVPPADRVENRVEASVVSHAKSTHHYDNSAPYRSGKPSAISPLPPASTSRMFPEEEEEEEFDPFKYIGIILRRKNIVLVSILIMTLLSVYKFLSGDKYYIAHARLLFRPGDQEIIGDANLYRSFIDRDKIFSTHLELLKSHTVLNIVSQNIDNRISEQDIKDRLTIKQGEIDGKKNDIIELSFRHPNPDTARDIINELCKTYIDYRRGVNAQELTRFIFKFETQINKLQGELDLRENDLRRFKEENQMVQLSSETNLTVSKLSEMELALQKTQLDLLESKDRFSALHSQINLQDHDIVQSITFQDPLQTRIADLELELNASTAGYSQEHYKVKTLKQQIENLKSAAIDSITREAASKTLVKNPIRQALLHDLVNLTIEKAALEAKRIAQQKIIEKLNGDLLQLPSLEQKYANLQRETESQIQTLRMLKTKYEETKIKRDSQESDLKLLEMAETPVEAMSNVKLSNIIIGILIGLILGIALVFIIEYLDQSLKDPADVEKQLELPLLGIVPLIETERKLIEQSIDPAKTMLEPFRALRANLKHIAAAHELKTFMICSAVKGEGKTTLAANLAITFALDGRTVILIDADLRRSQMHSLFGIPRETGVADFLMGTVPAEQIIKPTIYPNLLVVTSGERPSNPAELLGTIRFDLLIKELKNRAEIVIFDSPALLPVSDTITMAPKMDCCVVVTRALWTPLKAARQAKNQLMRIGCHLYGAILNGVSHAKNYYPYSYGYYGYYSYKYDYEDDMPESRFSFRKIGLKLENGLKNRINCTAFAFPKYIAAVSRLIRYVTGSKCFWILLSVLLAVTGLRIWYQAHYQQPADSIKYLGITDSHNDTQNMLFDSLSDMALPKRKTEGSYRFHNPLPDTSDDKADISDSIKQWDKTKPDSNNSWIRGDTVFKQQQPKAADVRKF